MLHAPVPDEGVFAERIALVAQIVKSVPALEVTEPASTLIVTSSVLTAQTPLLIVQRKVVDEPAVKLFTVAL